MLTILLLERSKTFKWCNFPTWNILINWLFMTESWKKRIININFRFMNNFPSSDFINKISLVIPGACLFWIFLFKWSKTLSEQKACGRESLNWNIYNIYGAGNVSVRMPPGELLQLTPVHDTSAWLQCMTPVHIRLSQS